MKRLGYLFLFLLTLSLVLLVVPIQNLALNQSQVVTIAANNSISDQFELKLPAYPLPTKLKIDSSQRFLVREDGSPFIWIGDTFWRFTKLTRQQRLQLLDDRQSKGFNVVMIKIGREEKEELAGFDSNLEPIESQFQEIDYFIQEAQKRGIYIAIATGWWQIIPDYDAATLYKFGKFIGDRYKDNDNIIWLGAGESGSNHQKQKLDFERVESLVQGIRDGDTGNKLLTLHADYQRGTSISKMNTLVDFDNWQTSQWCCPEELPRGDRRHWTAWQAIAYDYQQSPTKPTLDIEAWYENTNLDGGKPATPDNIRRRAYFTILAGGFGHSYGAAGIWDATSDFDQALQLTGAKQIGYLSQFFHALGKDFLKLRPSQSMILAGQSASYDQHIQASSANDGSYALVYTSGTREFTLNLSSFNAASVSVIWFNPQTKALSSVDAISNDSQVKFTTPAPGDWLLVLGR